VRQPPDFDPYELLGLDASADATTIDRAYKARIRYVHPDVAGDAGLVETKRLNIAREWLLDPELRASLPRPRPAWWRWRTDASAPPSPPPPPPPSQQASAPPRPEPPRAARPAWDYDPLEDDPLAFDFGSHAERVQALFEAIRALSGDERARVTYSLGDEPPILFDQFRDVLGERLWARSRALHDAISRVWAEREEEDRPLLFPRGRVFGSGAVVANAYAQWLVLEDVLRQRTRDEGTIALVVSRCTWPWEASIGHPRYGAHEPEVLAFLADARELSLTSAERLARSWHRHMGSYLYGRPGEDWFPGSLDHAGPELVSARVAAVDASRIEPPEGLPYRHHNGFRFGLRLTAHVLGLGSPDLSGRDYLRPWREALDPNPPFRDRARWGMPIG
jgi:hypothetical protein